MDLQLIDLSALVRNSSNADPILIDNFDQHFLHVSMLSNGSFGRTIKLLDSKNLNHLVGKFVKIDKTKTTDARTFKEASI